MIYRKEVAGLPGKTYETKFEGVITVPNGMWVATVESKSDQELHDYGSDELGDFVQIFSWEYEIIGVEPSSVQRYILEHHSSGGFSYSYKSSWARTLLVCEQPFGIVRWQTEYGATLSGRYFVCAKQINNRDEGKKPEIDRPKFVRQAAGPERIGHQRKVRQHGWARLADVAEFAGMTPQELVQTYFVFTHAEYPHLDVICARDSEQIRGKHLPWSAIDRYDNRKIVELLSVINDKADMLWIRQGFVVTILYLIHFGYVPKQVEAISAS